MDDAVGAYFSWWSADGDEVEGLGRTAAVEQTYPGKQRIMREKPSRFQLPDTACRLAVLDVVPVQLRHTDWAYLRNHLVYARHYPSIRGSHSPPFSIETPSMRAYVRNRRSL